MSQVPQVETFFSIHTDIPTTHQRNLLIELSKYLMLRQLRQLRQLTNNFNNHYLRSISTRHQRYETSTSLEKLVNEADKNSADNNCSSLSKLICTVGPSSHSPKLIQKLVDQGMQVMRINCSKSSVQETKERVQWLRACQGLQGNDQKKAQSPTPAKPSWKDKTSTRPLNLRSVMFDAKTDEHFKLAVEMDIDFISFNASNLTKVKSNLDGILLDLQSTSNNKTGSIPKLIAKIQSADALIDFDEILQVSDGILIERKLLARDIPLGVVRAQKQIVHKCNVAGKPVIIASQMLDTMIDHPTPTRAEVSDIVNAVYDGADCVMLSRESSEGRYPIESCITLARIARQADMSKPSNGNGRDRTGTIETLKVAKDDNNNNTNQDFFNQGVWPAMCRSAVQQAKYGDIDLIVVVTASGKTAEMLSAEKGPVPIMAFVGDAKVGRQLSMHRGVQPVYGEMKHMPIIQKKVATDNISMRQNKEKMDMVHHELLMVRPKEAVIRAKELNMVKTGDTVLIVMSEPSNNVLGRALTTRTARVK